MDHSTIILTISLVAGLYMAWSIGANDVANALGTGVGSRALTIKQAVIIAAIFEFVGAFLAGDQVTNTIKQEIIDTSLYLADPMVLAIGMTSALLSTAFWLQFASAKGLPVSTTHSIIGAVVGFGMITGGVQAVHWQALSGIVVSWFISPFLGGIIAFSTFILIRRCILDSADPLEKARTIGPLMLFVVVLAVSFVFFEKVLSHFTLRHQELVVFGTAASLAFIVSLFASDVLVRLKKVSTGKCGRDEGLLRVEKVFACFQLVTACFMALAHGSNDVANAIGPVSAVVAIAKSGQIVESSPVPLWLLGMGGVGIVIGLATYGLRVIETVGRGITEITPTRGFAAEFGTAFTVLAGSYIGLPLSTTQVLVGAIIGVGFARGISGLNVDVIKRIMGSWLVTIPTTGFISALLCYIWLSLRLVI